MNMNLGATGSAARLIHKAISALVTLLVSVGAASPASAQTPNGTDSRRPFEISDNSFLVEEALNQERGVFQNIFNVALDRQDQWMATFTQEWPLPAQTHQVSYTIPYASTGLGSGMGDVVIHYRWQAVAGEGAAPAFSPRVSLIVPSGSVSRGLGQGDAGWEINLPFSKQVRDVYFHWNAGLTHFPTVIVEGREYDLLTPRVAASGIWRVRPMVNFMLETVVDWPQEIDSMSDERIARITFVPGLRTGWNVGESQTIVGVGAPITHAEGSRRVSLFLYVSYELPFARR